MIFVLLAIFGMNHSAFAADTNLEDRFCYYHTGWIAPSVIAGGTGAAFLIMGASLVENRQLFGNHYSAEGAALEANWVLFPVGSVILAMSMSSIISAHITLGGIRAYSRRVDDAEIFSRELVRRGGGFFVASMVALGVNTIFLCTGAIWYASPSLGIGMSFVPAITLLHIAITHWVVAEDSAITSASPFGVSLVW